MTDDQESQTPDHLPPIEGFVEDILFTPLQLGAVNLEHRVVMAPLTRQRADIKGVPHIHAREYYGQRASYGGLLITEATDISADAIGYPGTPGIYAVAHIEAWRAITDAVHAKNGLIFLQIWHTGRVSHSSLRPGNAQPVAPSAVPIRGMQHVNSHGQTIDFETPRPLTQIEIEDIIESFVQGTQNAQRAGFDGVEIHSANGYLINQFLQDGTNQRTDEYGGSIENRSRFLLEVVDAVISAWEPGRVGVRLSPWTSFNEVSDSNPAELYNFVAAQLNKRNLAYLHVVEPRVDQSSDVNALDPNAPDASEHIRKNFKGPIISAGGFVLETAIKAVSEKRSDAIAFGRSFIANPDLPRRLCLGAPLNQYDRQTFYTGGDKGYTDYPFLDVQD